MLFRGRKMTYMASMYFSLTLNLQKKVSICRYLQNWLLVSETNTPGVTYNFTVSKQDFSRLEKLLCFSAHAKTLILMEFDFAWAMKFMKKIVHYSFCTI